MFVILSTSGYPPATVEGNFYYYLLILPVFILYFKLKKMGKLWPHNITTYTFLLFLFLTIISYFFNFKLNNFSTNIKFLLVISFSYFFCLSFQFYLFSKYYIKAIKIISIVSLVGYSILNLTTFFIPLSTFKNINDVEYYNGIIFFAIKSFSVWGNSGVNRNIGAFWEPGLFATFILIAIVLELWQKKKTSKLNILIFLITLLTTKSTFAYLMLLPIGVSIFSNKRKKLYVSIILNTSIVSLFVFVLYNTNKLFYYLFTINPAVFEKLIIESNSVNDRIEAPLANLKIFQNNFMFGAGIGNTENLFTGITEGSQTSTSTYFLAAFGFLGIAYTLLFIYGVLSYKEVNIVSRFMFLIILLSQINKEPHIYFTTTFILLFYFLKESRPYNSYVSKEYK